MVATPLSGRHCIPGASLNDISAAFYAISRDANAHTLLLIHAGTINVKSARSEVFLSKYRDMIYKYRIKLIKYMRLTIG